ncbi:MAG TPA: putative lipopolysaccharide heptosyltransferase III [Nitrospirales bacterium]|nr:putative lipopolysaccharide heptosyltransferase III [Nitrospirales bacterium]
MLDPLALNEILVIKLRYLGDVLLMTPCLQVIKENLPHANVTVVVNKGTEAVLHNHPYADDVVTVDRRSFVQRCRAVMRLRKRRYDLVLDLTDGDRSAIMTRLVNARYRVGYNAEHRWRGRCYDQIIHGDPDELHSVDYYLQAITDIGLNVSVHAPTLSCAPDDEQYAHELLVDHGIDREEQLVMIHSGARWEAKSWLAERFAAVADTIQVSRSTRVVFAGSEQERARVKDIQAQMSTTSVSIVGQTTVLQLAAVMKRCVLFLGNDNGPMHMAAAVGLPVVALFGPTNPKVWGPWGKGHRVFFKDVDCRACFLPGCHLGLQSCMAQISVDEVMDAIDDCLMSKNQKGQSTICVN